MKQVKAISLLPCLLPVSTASVCAKRGGAKTKTNAARSLARWASTAIAPERTADRRRDEEASCRMDDEGCPNARFLTGQVAEQLEAAQ